MDILRRAVPAFVLLTVVSAAHAAPAKNRASWLDRPVTVDVHQEPLSVFLEKISS